MEEGSVINMLQKIYGEFSPMEKKAANYILTSLTSIVHHCKSMEDKEETQGS